MGFGLSPTKTTDKSFFSCSYSYFNLQRTWLEPRGKKGAQAVVCVYCSSCGGETRAALWWGVINRLTRISCYAENLLPGQDQKKRDRRHWVCWRKLISLRASFLFFTDYFLCNHVDLHSYPLDCVVFHIEADVCGSRAASELGT